MEINKINGNIAFSEEEHKYWDVNTNKKYISVTTLISKFEQPFDKEFWSKYKALEQIMGKDKFNLLEKPKLLKTKKWNDSILDLYDINSLDFNNAQQNILDEWAKTNAESCERGTAIHAKMENKFYTGAKSYSLKSYGLGGSFECKKDYTPLDLENGVYPEYLISRESLDGELRLAGQIDLLVKQGNSINIIDYKTNAKIDKKSGYDAATKHYAMMQYPLNNLMDCNFMHYSLQLSTYAWMIEKNNPQFNINKLIIVHIDHSGKVTLHDVEYLKPEVERMLVQYKKLLKKEEREAKRKRIEF